MGAKRIIKLELTCNSCSRHYTLPTKPTHVILSFSCVIEIYIYIYIYIYIGNSDSC